MALGSAGTVARPPWMALTVERFFPRRHHRKLRGIFYGLLDEECSEGAAPRFLFLVHGAAKDRQGGGHGAGSVVMITHAIDYRPVTPASQQRWVSLDLAASLLGGYQSLFPFTVASQQRGVSLD